MCPCTRPCHGIFAAIASNRASYIVQEHTTWRWRLESQLHADNSQAASKSSFLHQMNSFIGSSPPYELSYNPCIRYRMFVAFLWNSIAKVLGVALKSGNSKGECQHIDHVRTFIQSMSINAKLLLNEQLRLFIVLLLRSSGNDPDRNFLTAPV